MEYLGNKHARYDAQLDGQNEHLLAELDECRENNEHPDTGEQLTKADIETIPWLSPDTIRQTEDDNDDEENDGDVGNIVPQKTGLKRSAKPKAASGPLELPEIPLSPSFESTCGSNDEGVRVP